MPVLNQPSRGGGRVVIEAVTPQVTCGRFPVKRVVGEKVVVEADIFADGHDRLCASLLFRRISSKEWTEAPMESFLNDHWRGRFEVEAMGYYEFTIEGWIDHFGSWAEFIQKKIASGQEVSVELEVGSRLIREASDRATGHAAERLKNYADALVSGGEQRRRIKQAQDEELKALMECYPDRSDATRLDKILTVWVDRPRARFGSWYEMFPRSSAIRAGVHGTFQDVEQQLPYLAELGVDVLYLPPIHPIGKTFRKGKNNALEATPGEPGSPWGIGSSEGGHKSIHPQLGTLDSFRKLMDQAAEYEIEVALDIALQCSPDHPYVNEHPEWFKKRPDGTIQYAENPPKKYQDIFPFDFETPAWESLWNEMKSIFDFWISQGVRIFRVDNPHTKPFAFWEWLISSIRNEHPDTIFFAEAFTRPHVMHRLAKLGFTQSYSYFTWRNDKWEIEQYLTELSQADSREFFRPNLWPNTPDILHAYLQKGGRPAFIARLALAATAGANYGIYGPAFELCVNVPKELGTEEYLDSEKYEIKTWDLEDPNSIAPIVSKLNKGRRANQALQSDWSLRMLRIDNPFLIAYYKATEDRSNIVLTVVNLDSVNTQIGWVDVPLEEFKIGWDERYQVHDLLTDNRYVWRGGRNYIELNPLKMPAHVFVVEKLVDE